MRSRGFLAISVAALTLALVAGLAAPGAGATTKHKARASQQLPYENANLPVQQRVADLLGRMTLDEKIGQMTQAERASVDKDTSQITTWNLGSLLSGGGSTPATNNAEAPPCARRWPPAGGSRVAPRPMLCGSSVAPSRLPCPWTESTP